MHVKHLCEKFYTAGTVAKLIHFPQHFMFSPTYFWDYSLHLGRSDGLFLEHMMRK